jgi:hypothetical protein
MSLKDLEELKKDVEIEIKRKKEYEAWYYRVKRGDNGITLRGMAKLLGISATHLSDMELGRKPFLDKWKTKYNKILGLK